MSLRLGTLAIAFIMTACHSSGKRLEDAEVPAADAPALDSAVPVDLAPDLAEPVLPDAAPDASPDAVPDSAPDRPLAADARPDLSVDRAAIEVAEVPPALQISFNNCVISDVGSKPNVFAVSGATLLAADFDRDGTVDVAVGTWPDSHVIALKGKGDGSFKVASTKIMTAEPRSLGIADFDKDGIPDVVVGGKKETSVNVLRGRADGSLADPVSYAGPAVTGIATGDLNGDGLIDVIIGNADILGTAGVYLGTAGGGLGPVTYLGSMSNPRQPVLADFDKDGRLDLMLMADAVSAARNNGVLTFRGRGDGSFESIAPYETVFDQSLLIPGDFTADGIIDVISLGGSSNVVMLVGKGDGTFVNPPRKLNLGGSLDGWAAADFDRDGLLDLAHSQGNYLSIYHGNGDGTFATPVTFWFNGWGKMVATDFDSDGRIDLVAAKTGVGGIGEICAFRNTSK